MAAFVGRRDEFATLDDVAATAGRGGVAGAVVVGEPGCGKSRLLAEVADRGARGRRFRVVGYEPERHVPLAAAAELLRGLSELGSAGPTLDSVVFGAPAFEPVQIFETAHRLLRPSGPVLLLVDDVQWADEASLALCHYLVRAAEADGPPLAVLAAGRPSPGTASLAASLRRVLGPERLAEMELPPLTPDEATELAHALAPEIDEAAARELAERSGGSPFWLEALARTGGAETEAGSLITARLRGASADAASLVALLAVAARPLALDDAAALSDWTVERAEHAARELVARGVAVESAGAVRLAHDLIRAAAARELPEERRADVNRRLAAWLRRIAGSDVRRLREALGHLHAAGQPTVDLALRLARSPQRTLIGDEGLELLVAIANGGDPADPHVLGLDRELAALASALARHDVALERRLLLGERSPDPLERARSYLEAARSAFALDDGEHARVHLDRARGLAVGDEVFELECAVQEAVLDLWSEERKTGARRVAHAVAERARKLFETDERARPAYLEALRVEYEAAFQEDDVDAMLRTTEDRAAAARGFDEEAHLTSLIAGARALRRAGRLDEALERARYAWDEAGRRVWPRLTLDAGYWLGMVLLHRGRVADAEEIGAEVGDLAARVGDEGRGRHAIERFLAEIEFHRGDWQVGVDRLLAYAGRRGRHAGVELHGHAALWLGLAGGMQLAGDVVQHVSLARACAKAAGCPRCATELRLTAAEALARVGRHGEATRSLEAWERLQPRPQPRDIFLHRRVRALLDGSPELLESAAEEAEALDFLLDALWTRVDLASVLADSDRTAARETLERTVVTAAGLGAFTTRRVAEQRLRALGVRTWRRGTGAELLTERETEVARLVAAGASNPEIAQRLFLSRKTVERHISNVLRKVGVRNRAELAAKVTKLEFEGAHR